MLKQFFVHIVSKTYVGIVSFCSVVSVIALFVDNKNACIIALSTILIGTIICTVAIINGIKKFTEKNCPTPYRRIASFFIYTAENRVSSTFEAYRIIQCKRPFLNSIPYNFKWTGSKQPEVKSLSHSLENITYSKDENSWDSAIIKFQKPLKYNECAVVNLKFTNEDTEKKSKPWISAKVDSPVEMITYRVQLSYKRAQYNKPSVFERKKIDMQIDGEYEHLQYVDFDNKYKSYYFRYHNPESGYIYRLRWER